MIGDEIEDGPRHDRLYRGQRLKDVSRVIAVDAPEINRELAVDDPDWGADTPGTVRLAQALLEDAIDADMALERRLPERLSPGFAAEVLARLPRHEPWILWRLDILDWAHEQLEVARA